MRKRQYNTPELVEITKDKVALDLVSAIYSYLSDRKVTWYEDYFPAEGGCFVKLAFNNKAVYLMPPTPTRNTYKYEFRQDDQKMLAGIFELEELHNILKWLIT